MELKRLLLRIALSAIPLCPSLAQAEASSHEINEANNPLAPELAVSFQDYYTGSFYGLGDSDANMGLLRSTRPHKAFGLPQITRVTIPVVTSADEPFGSTSGVGDINIFNVFLFKKFGLELGIGPQLTIPVSTRDQLGTEKWQGGVAVIAIAPQEWGLLGGLVTWQQSFAGSDFRADQNNIQTQPFIIYNLPAGFYARSTATWNFNAETGDHYIPAGIGAGKVWKLEGGTTINLFTEPQWTLIHEGVAPQFQLFTGLNLQFPLG